jgi:hypothetical protein
MVDPRPFASLALPPTRSAEPVSHRSAGRDYFSIRYVVGWPADGLIKVGSAMSLRRVRRWTSMRQAELIDLAYYPIFKDIESEAWLQRHLAYSWPSAFSNKEEARPYLGCNLGGYTEFFAIPAEDWDAVRRLAAL